MLLGGCAVTNDEWEQFILGKWESDQRGSEWGMFVMQATFENNHKFRVESFFGESQELMVVEGEYKVVGSNLITTTWNAGKPIEMNMQNNDIILKIPGEEPLLLHRMKGK